jgi:hypothetical protein
MAKLQYPIPAWTIAPRDKRAFYQGEQPHGAYPPAQEPPYVPVIRKLTSHRCHGPRDQYLYWLQNYGVKVMEFNRTLRRDIWRAWKNELTPDNRTHWRDEAPGVILINFKNAPKVPNGFSLFTWHHFFKSCDTWPTSFPFQGALPALDYDPPSPYVLPDPPNISGLRSSDHDGFTVDVDNWPTDGKQLCLTSIQRLSTATGKFTRSHKLTGATAGGQGAGGIGYLDVHPLYPWPDPEVGTTFRFGLRYRLHAGDPAIGPASPTAAEDMGGGDAPWSDAYNILQSDDTTAQATVYYYSGPNITNPIHATAFEWDPPIPDDVTIAGIFAEVMAQELNRGGGIKDHVVRLLKAGVAVGANKAQGTWVNDQAWPWPYTEYGGPDDLWEETWTGADLNDPAFGLEISAAATGEHGTDLAAIEHVRLTAFYGAAAPIPSNPTYYDWTRPA